MARFALGARQQTYLSEHFEIDTKRRSATDVLRYLMERNSMSASDLGRLRGDRSLGSRLLNGTRRLSKQHIRALCRRFGVSADRFP